MTRINLSGGFVIPVLLVAGQLSSQDPAQERARPAQPIPYSHKTHLKLGLKCEDCHPNPNPGVIMAFPVAAKCMACHTTVARDKPAIQKLAELSASQQPIPWVRVYTLPNFVDWKHRTHLKAGAKCAACHGDVAEVDVTTRVTNITKMAACVDCHRQNHASIECSFCHDLN